MKRRMRALVLMMIVLVTLALGASPAAADTVVGSIRGHGYASLTYLGTDLPAGPYEGKFRIVGKVEADGSADGRIRMIFKDAGAAAWGALPGAVEARLHLAGKVTAGSIRPDGSVELRGVLTETDYLADGSIGFQIDGEPFTFIAGGDLPPDTFEFTWCALNWFDAELNRGQLRVRGDAEEEDDTEEEDGATFGFDALMAQSSTCTR